MVAVEAVEAAAPVVDMAMLLTQEKRDAK
jgi:hypothetical protein